MELRKFQKNEIAEIVKKFDAFHHKDFTWVTNSLGEADVIYSGLVYKDTNWEFYFKIWGDSGDVYYSPGEIHMIVQVEDLDWGVIKTEFSRWLCYLRSEVLQPDLWEEYLNQEFTTDARTITDLSNEKFTEPEIEKIIEGTNSVKAYIEDEGLADDDQMKHVKEQLDYLVDTSKRLGKKDWFHICLSVLNGIFINLALQPENKEFIFNIMKQALSSVKGFLGV